MAKIRKGDLVWVIKGRDRGKSGKVLKVLLPARRKAMPTSWRGRVRSPLAKAIVGGINLVKKHKRQVHRQDQQAGIISVESPISIANLMFFCRRCNRPVRLGKSRICKTCKEAV
jgi:large subunit ribosomal protein L24